VPVAPSRDAAVDEQTTAAERWLDGAAVEGVLQSTLVISPPRAAQVNAEILTCRLQRYPSVHEAARRQRTRMGFVNAKGRAPGRCKNVIGLAPRAIAMIQASK
jgi:hypothetical protein